MWSTDTFSISLSPVAAICTTKASWSVFLFSRYPLVPAVRMPKSWTNNQSTSKHQPQMQSRGQCFLNMPDCSWRPCAFWFWEHTRSSPAGFAEAGSSISNRSWSRQLILRRNLRPACKERELSVKSVKIFLVDFLTGKYFGTETSWHTVQTMTRS